MPQLNSAKVDYLSNIQVFRDLTPNELAQMDRQVTMSTCKPGKIFYMPEDSGEVLFLLKKGRVQLYRIAPNGKKLVVATLGPGAIFGEMSLVGQGMHNTFAESVDECVLCVMSRSDVERLVQEKPEVAFRFVEALGNRLTQLEAHLEDIAFKSIPTRLAALLLKLQEEQGGRQTVTGYTHQDLSEMLGTYRETVTQTLNDLKADGLISIARKQVVLKDMPRLRQLADA
ncbi:Crp/Fnr family transcriptional regulator [Candidatus Leptofilum sp.]|uniref:Crp/Fnr family transcriptional regulator n=1 Tax=Candidatus Leptofilum sp. TaxID=3241576 RepID=UPI003B5B34BD